MKNKIFIVLLAMSFMICINSVSAEKKQTKTCGYYDYKNDNVYVFNIYSDGTIKFKDNSDINISNWTQPDPFNGFSAKEHIEKKDKCPKWIVYNSKSVYFAYDKEASSNIIASTDDDRKRYERLDSGDMDKEVSEIEEKIDFVNRSYKVLQERNCTSNNTHVNYCVCKNMKTAGESYISDLRLTLATYHKERVAYSLIYGNNSYKSAVDFVQMFSGVEDKLKNYSVGKDTSNNKSCDDIYFSAEYYINHSEEAIPSEKEIIDNSAAKEAEKKKEQGEDDIEVVCGMLTKNAQDFIYRILDWIKYIALILTVALSILDFFKAMSSEEDDSFKKAASKLAKRIIIVVLLFILPVLLEFVLKLVHIQGVEPGNPLCM